MSAPENCSESAATQSQHTQAILLMTQAMQSQTAALEAQTAALKDLAASNRTLAKAMLDDDGDDVDQEFYLDGTPK